MRKFVGMMHDHANLMEKHNELLLKHDIAISRNLGDGWTILDNITLKKKLVFYQLQMAEEAP